MVDSQDSDSDLRKDLERSVLIVPERLWLASLREGTDEASQEDHQMPWSSQEEGSRPGDLDFQAR